MSITPQGKRMSITWVTFETLTPLNCPWTFSSNFSLGLGKRMSITTRGKRMSITPVTL